MADLILPMKGIYFDQIKAGQKPYEYRLVNEYWRKRLIGREYRKIILLRGYPKSGGVEGQTRLTLAWRGFGFDRITHPHFGSDPVEVFAIKVGHRMTAKQRKAQP